VLRPVLELQLYFSLDFSLQFLFLSDAASLHFSQLALVLLLHGDQSFTCNLQFAVLALNLRF
jgi:hypothetical protein